jgi:hypothetical protein
MKRSSIIALSNGSATFCNLDGEVIAFKNRLDAIAHAKTLSGNYKPITLSANGGAWAMHNGSASGNGQTIPIR